MLSERQRRFLSAMEIPVWTSREKSAAIDEQDAVPSEISSPTWDALIQQIESCQRCALSTTRQHVVVGSGPQSVDLCIIGEAPGAAEDAQGLPFVGSAGQLLTAMLQAIGCDREKVYITNIVKCRPPENRDPAVDEIKSCSSHLLAQLDRLKPKAILLLGKIAAQTLLETDKPLRELRGQSLTFSESAYPVVVTYHPAYLLRKPAEKAKALADLLRLKQLLSDK